MNATLASALVNLMVFTLVSLPILVILGLRRFWPRCRNKFSIALVLLNVFILGAVSSQVVTHDALGRPANPDYVYTTPMNLIDNALIGVFALLMISWFVLVGLTLLWIITCGVFAWDDRIKRRNRASNED